MLHPNRDRIVLLLTLDEIMEMCAARGVEIQSGEHPHDPIVQAIYLAAEKAVDGREVHVGRPQGGQDGVETEPVPSDGASTHDARPIDIRSRRPIEEEQGAGEQLPLPSEGEEWFPNTSGDVLPSREGTPTPEGGGEAG